MTSQRMPTTRPRRIVRRAVLALVVVVLLPVWYVGGWIAISKLINEGYIGRSVADHGRPLFLPLIRYCESGFPAGRLLGNSYWSLNPPNMIEIAPSSTLVDVPAMALAPNLSTCD